MPIPRPEGERQEFGDEALNPGRSVSRNAHTEAAIRRHEEGLATFGMDPEATERFVRPGGDGQKTVVSSPVKNSSGRYGWVASALGEDDIASAQGGAMSFFGDFGRPERNRALGGYRTPLRAMIAAGHHLATIEGHASEDFLGNPEDAHMDDEPSRMSTEEAQALRPRRG